MASKNIYYAEVKLMDLSSFFRENAVKTHEIKYVASNRFVGEDKQPIEWILTPITSQTDEDLRRQATNKIKNKFGQYQSELDTNKYIGLLAVACTVYPNLNDAKLQNSYDVMGADSLLKKMLLPGEYANYLSKVQEICGFDQNINDMVQQAKN